MYILLICLILLLLILVYMVVIEPNRLKETHYFIRKIKKTVLNVSNALDLYEGKTSMTIAQLSDFHFSRWYSPYNLNRVIRRLTKSRPDMVIFTGDLIDNYSRWPHKKTNLLIKKLSKIPAPIAKIAILGNHDYTENGQFFVKEILRKSGFTVLVNDQVFYSNDRVSITIMGMDDEQYGNPVYKFEDTFAEWQILLTHEPDSVENFRRIHHFDLVLSGHSHGGQIRLPFYRKKNKGALKYTDGLYLVSDETLLSVNTGMGTTIFPARLGVVPEITYYHLEKEEKSINLVEKNETKNEQPSSEK